MSVRVGQRKDKPGWWVFVSYRGRRMKKCFPDGRMGEKAARTFAEKLLAKMKWAEMNGEDVFVAPERTMPTIGEFLQRWFVTYAGTNCRESTRDEYERAISTVLVPRFGQKSVDALTRDDVEMFIADCVQEGKARSTIRNYLAPLRAAFYQAVERGIVGSNPVSRIGKLVRRARRTVAEIQPLQRQEADALLNTAVSTPWLYSVILCFLRAGLRRGELIGLQLWDLDFENKALLVRRSVTRGRVGRPKSGKTRRVDMSPQLCQTLLQELGTREQAALADGNTLQAEEWVFLSPEGYRLDERNLVRSFQECAKAARLRKIRLHDLRHTFASQLIEQGAHPKYIQEQLGHSSINVTMDNYGHLFPNRNRGLVDQLDTAEVGWDSAPQQHPRQEPRHVPLVTPPKMARPTGLEPVTPRSVVWCSIH